ncbi:MAG: hypothetical protein NC915_05140 [Candidatus Omnitrophica bacterium]|nr:hypothetical protein [Candidatus Omnitrophota bacterium]
MKKYSFLFLFLILLNSCFSIKFSNYEEVILINPYKDVNWDKVKRYKANLHTHTKESDGKEPIEKVIFLYKSRGYSILSITDHNKFTYPSDNKEIFLIKGIEFGKNQHHILGYFSFKVPENIENLNEDEILKLISEDGFAVFSHPGRYNKSIDWYINFFEKYPNLLGIEVLNPSVQKKKSYGDTDIWDEILSKTMPERQVWGFGNDDFHNITHLSINWNEFLIDKINEEEIKKAIKGGKFYICSAILGFDMPYIKKIIIDGKKGEIKIEAENYKKIRWISNGKLIEEGEKIKYKKNPDIKNYIRVEIIGEQGFIYLNPFAVIRSSAFHCPPRRWAK